MYADDGEYGLELFAEYQRLLPQRDADIFLGKDIFKSYFKKTYTKEQLKKLEKDEAAEIISLKQQ